MHTWIALGRTSLFFVTGIVAGLVAAWLNLFRPMQEVEGLAAYFSFWIVVGTVIAVLRPDPWSAASDTSLFFVGILVSYCVHTLQTVGFLPITEFSAWMFLVFFSFVGGYAVWYSREQGWTAAFCSALPIALVANGGAMIWVTRSIPDAMSLFFAGMLLWLLPRTMGQRVRVVLLSGLLVLVLVETNIINLVLKDVLG